MPFVALSESDYAAWDSMVEASPTGTIFHSTAWLRSTGEPFRAFGMEQGGSLVAGITLFEHRVLGQRVARGAPLTPYTGVISAARKGKPAALASARKELLAQAARFLSEHYSMVALQLAPQVTDIQALLWAGYTPRVRYTYILDVSDLELCWSELDPKRRSGIRKAQKDGCTVRRESDPTSLMNLVARSYARQGKPIGFARAAAGILEDYPDRDRLGFFVARDASGTAVAGVLVVWDGRRGYYLLGGHEHDGGHNDATALALWTAIVHTREARGLNEFDFEGSSVPRIERFFRKFGGRIVPRFDVQWARQAFRLPLALREAVRRAGPHA